MQDCGTPTLSGWLFLVYFCFVFYCIGGYDVFRFTSFEELLFVRREMEKEKKTNLVVQRIISALVFVPICMLSVLSLNMFISDYLALIFSGGALGFSVIWLIIYANRKYGFCDLHLPIFPLANRIAGFINGLLFLFISSLNFEQHEFGGSLVAGVALGMFSISLFSRTKKKSINDYRDPFERPIGRKSLFFILLFWGLFWSGCCVYWCMSIE